MSFDNFSSLNRAVAAKSGKRCNRFIVKFLDGTYDRERSAREFFGDNMKKMCEYNKALNAYAIDVDVDDVPLMEDHPQIEFIEEDMEVFSHGLMDTMKSLDNLNVNSNIIRPPRRPLVFESQRNRRLRRRYNRRRQSRSSFSRNRNTVRRPSEGTSGGGSPALNFQLLDWGTRRIGGITSSAVTGDGQGSVTGAHVFILDTGCTHQDLNIVEAVNYSSSTTSNDIFGHGTHVAGIVGAKDNRAFNVGIAPDIPIHSIKVLNDSGSGTISGVIQGIDHVVNWKNANPTTPVIVNMSLGLITSSFTALDQAVQNAMSLNIIFCISSGNSGIDVSQVSPAHTPGVISVSAYDINNTMPTWSNYGGDLSINAPGVNILSLFPRGVTGMSILSGTSMASPQVAGVAALLTSQNPGLTNTQVEQDILEKANTANQVQLNPSIILPSSASNAGTTTLGAWAGNY